MNRSNTISRCQSKYKENMKMKTCKNRRDLCGTMKSQKYSNFSYIKKYANQEIEEFEIEPWNYDENEDFGILKLNTNYFNIKQ